MLFKKNYLLLFLICSLSCSKTETPPPIIPPPVVPVVPVVAVVNCKITAAAVVSSTGDTARLYTYQYNTDGTLSQSTQFGMYGYTASYTYNGKLIYRSVAAGINSSVDTFTLNDAGMVSLRKETIGATTYTTHYTYDVNGQLTMSNQDSTSQTQGYSIFYKFTNGDNTLIGNANGSDRDTLIYDITKPAVTGNMDMVNQVLNDGAMYIRNKHLLVEEHRGTTVLYSYTYTAEGNIASIKLSINAVNSGATTYTYECK
jgi:hypothetical protein